MSTSSCRILLPSILILILAAGCEPADHTGALDPDEPFAQRVEAPPEAEDDPVLGEYVRTLERSPVPSHAEVSIPAYPGARVAQSTRGAHIETLQHEERHLPALTLLAVDTPDQVADFYRTELSGWHEIEAADVRWFTEQETELGRGTGQEGFADPPPRPMDSTIRAVGVIPAGARVQGLMPGALTEIHMRYDPAVTH